MVFSCEDPQVFDSRATGEVQRRKETESMCVKGSEKPKNMVQ